MKTDFEVIQEALTHMETSTLEEILNDIKLAKKQKTSKCVRVIINSYENKKNLNDEKERKKYDKDLCLKLKDLKPDFIPLFQMYNILVDKQKCDKLRKHFIIKRDEDEESFKINNEILIFQNQQKPVVELNLCLLYDENKYYSNLVKGILGLMKSLFEKSYLVHNCPNKFFEPQNAKINYENNKLSLKESLINIINDIDRVLTEHDINQKNYEENYTQTEIEVTNKIPEKLFLLYLKKANLSSDAALLKIYNNSEDNNYLLTEIQKLSKIDCDKYYEIELFVSEYIKSESLEKEVKNLKILSKEAKETIKSQGETIQSLNKELKEAKETIKSQGETIQSLNKELKEAKETIKSQGETIQSQGETIKSQGINITNLKEKVDFMEVIVNASLSRKVINHCMKKFVDKYKNSLKFLYNEKGEITKVQVFKDINEVPSKSSNDLIDFLYLKKDKCNNFVHFDGIKKPNFIEDIWETVFKFIELSDEQRNNFNKLFDKEIRDDFSFSQKDKSLKSM
jgi:predicted RNase H-like HicB family nuclease